MPNPCVLCLRLTGRPCLVVGGGEVAERKIMALSAAEACITVIAPEATERIRKLAQDGSITYYQRAFAAADAPGNLLIIAATSNNSENLRVAQLARQEHALVNIVDSPEESDFFVPACVKQGDLTIAISTNGKVPALAKKLRETIEAQFGQEYESYIHLLETVRKKIYGNATFTDAERRELMDTLLDLDLIDLLKSDNYADAKSVINKFVREHEI